MAESMSWDGEQGPPEVQLSRSYQPDAQPAPAPEPEPELELDQAPAAWPEDDRYFDERQDPDAAATAPARRDQRRDKVRRRAQAREARWQRNRLAVPYRTDGPKITFGVIWFAIVIGITVWSSALVLSIFLALVAGLAGLQLGHAWLPDFPAAKWWTAFAAVIAGVGGFIGPVGLGLGVALALAMLLIYIVSNPGHHRQFPELMDVLARSTIPVGLAAGSLAALDSIELGAILPLVVLVSAYEVGDFLVGSGSSNAVEGPLTGLVALGAALFLLWVVAPAPFTDRSMLLYGALAAVCCPLGQIMASGLLPRGNAWAPALRRLDSYLLAAPLWLLLLETAPTSTSL